MNGDAGTWEEATSDLPPMKDLIGRIPTAVTGALDELFRAKWTGVRRLRPEDLKGDAAGGRGREDGDNQGTAG